MLKDNETRYEINSSDSGLVTLGDEMSTKPRPEWVWRGADLCSFSSHHNRTEYHQVKQC